VVPVSDDGNRVTVTTKHDEHLRNAAMRNLSYGELTEHVESLLQQIAFGEEVGEQSAVRAELDNVRAEIDDLDAEIRQLRAEKERLQSEEKRLEERANSINAEQERYESKLESLVNTVETFGHIWAGDDDTEPHPNVADAAALGGTTPLAVVELFKDRGDARVERFSKACENDSSGKIVGPNQ
jgi:predicted nuclease with TOPRIM domain